MDTINHEIFKHGCALLFHNGFNRYIVVIYYHRYVNGELFMYSRCEKFHHYNAYFMARLVYLEMREYLGTLVETIK